MDVLVRQNKILVKSSSRTVLAKSKPYEHLWGYTLSKKDRTTDLYNWLYKCFDEGFSVQQRAVSGNVYDVEYHDAEHPASELFNGAKWLIIPLIQFNIPSTIVPGQTGYAAMGVNENKIRQHLQRVTHDNPLFQFCNTTEFEGYFSVFTETEGILETVRVIYPDDDCRAQARESVLGSVEVIKAKVSDVCGVSVGAELTETQKRNVSKVIHDWLLENTTYTDTITYWSHTMCSALDMDNTEQPVCEAYSLAYAYLCRLYGINCVYVCGSTDSRYPNKELHAWNLVSFVLPIGIYDNDESKWAAVDVTKDDSRYDGRVSGAPWEMFCADDVYHKAGNWRKNSSKGYPVDVPEKTYPYNGNTLYGIAEEDWEQGGDADV